MKRIIVILMLLGTAFALTFGMFFMSGCSDSKQAQKHFDKFIKNGGKIKPEYIYTERIDSVIVNGETKYIMRVDSVRVECPYQPKSNKELRHERKSWHHEYKMLKEKNAFTIDSLNKVIRLSKIEKKVRKIESKQVIKQTKAINQKAFKWYHWILISIDGIILLFIGFMVGKFLRL